MPSKAGVPWRGLLLSVFVLASLLRLSRPCTVFEFNISGFAGGFLTTFLCQLSLYNLLQFLHM